MNKFLIPTKQLKKSDDCLGGWAVCWEGCDLCVTDLLGGLLHALVMTSPSVIRGLKIANKKFLMIDYYQIS